MIATLNGTVSEKSIDTIILDVNGVGYGLLVPRETFDKAYVGEKLKVYVYEHIRENMYDLYGFTELQTKELFIKLINVNGVGPKVGLNILSIGPLSTVRQAIASGNLKLIQSAQGVGKKVAERVIIELKDKVGLISTVNEASLLVGDEVVLQDEAVQALVALGYSVNDAAVSLKEIDESLSTQERIRLALKTR
jgi:Holliday junction DNA helicase RuvA